MSFGATPNAPDSSSAVVRAALTRAYTVRQMTLSDGTAVREFTNASGVVFGVAWQGMSIPPLGQLLGEDVLARARTASAAVRAAHPGRGPVSVETTDLVFHSAGHPLAFFGNAYLPSLLPAGVSPNEIR
ncbi:MAG: DUF2844 domain-containing protein [Pararobbsia sp.]